MISINDTLQLQTQAKNLPQNATVQEFAYHKNQWKQCFSQNAITFETKVVAFQILCYSIGAFLLKNLKLTEEEKEAFEKSWKGFRGIRVTMIIRIAFFVVATLYLLMNIGKWRAEIPFISLKMPFFA
uniref:Uncharacterized protein n=1 Tax=Panagrolaimus sp. ES5 TaxID=591445 RepID=A0AC34FHR0_9BILA